MEFDAALHHFRRMLVTRVIKRRVTFHTESHASTQHFYGPNQPFKTSFRVRSGRRHVVNDLAHTL